MHRLLRCLKTDGKEKTAFFSADAPFPFQDLYHGFTVGRVVEFMVVEHSIYSFIKSLPFFLFHDKCVTLVLIGLAW